MEVVVFVLLCSLGYFQSVESIYDPHQADDSQYYALNAITDIDENSILSHGTTCPPNASGQFPYAMDCRQFLNCWKGRGTIQSCAPGTLFNPRSLECDHPSKVKCKSFDEFAKITVEPSPSAPYISATHRSTENSYQNSGNTGNTQNANVHQRVQCQSGASGLFAHPTDCTKFLNCNNGKTFTQDCGPGTAFNAITKICDWPQNVDCGSRSLSGSNPDSREEESYYGEGNIDPRIRTGNPNAEGGSSSSLESNNGANYQRTGHTRQGSYSNNGGGSININAQSSFGQQRPQHSSYGSQQTQLKNTDYNQNPPTYRTPYATQSKPNSGAIPAPTVFGGYSTMVSNSQSPNSNRTTNNLIHQTDSHSGYQNNGGLTGESLILNEDAKTETKKYSAVGSTYGNSQTSATDLTGSILDKNYELAIDVANLKCRKDVSGMYGHPFDCSKYINCYNGRTHFHQCGHGTVFNTKTNRCDWPQNFNCVLRSPPAEKLENYAQAKSYNSETSIYGQHPPQEIESDFIKETAVESHAVTTNSDKSFNVGAYDYGHRDQSGKQIQCKADASGLFPHPYDCTKFLNCDNGRTFVQDCGPGTAFNAELQVCDWPQNVDCDIREYDGPRVVEEDTENGEIRTPSVFGEGLLDERMDNRDDLSMGSRATAVHRGQYDSSRSYSQIRRSDSVQGAQNVLVIECDPGMTGLNEHPLYCAKFLSCEGGKTFINDCGPGTLFHPEEKICDFPYRVDCGTRQKPEKVQVNSPSFGGTKSQYPTKEATNENSKTNSWYPKENSFNSHGYNYNSKNATQPATRQYGPNSGQINRTQVPSYNKVYNQNHGAPVHFNFSDQTIDSQRKDQSLSSPAVNVNTKEWIKKTENTNHLNTIGHLFPEQDPQATTEKPFVIPDMSKVPLAEFPGTKYPVVPLDSNANPSWNTNSWENNFKKKVSQGGDVNNDFDFQTTHVASFLPSRKERVYPVYNSNPDQNTDSIQSVGGFTGRKELVPPKKNFSTGREHITPIYFRSTTPVPLQAPANGASYNNAYYKPTTEKPINPDIETDYLPISEALKILMRPYMNKNDTVNNVHINHTKTMEEKILHMADKSKNYRTDHTVSLEQDSLASADYDEANNNNRRVGLDSEEELPREVDDTNIGNTNPAKPSFHHDQNCHHYHPPNSHLPPNFKHTAKFHEHDHDHKHWAPSNPNHETNNFDENSNGDKPIVSGPQLNHHHNPHFHRHHSYPHHQNHPHHEHFQHDPNHPYHRGFHHNHHHHPNGIPSGRRNPFESTTPVVTSAQAPEGVDIRFNNPTEPIQFPQTNGNTAFDRDVESLPCTQFDCQTELCLPFNKVCDGRNDCGNRLDEQNCEHVGYEVRLSDDRGRKNMGRVEVKAFDKWGYICDDQFTMVDANVLCRELGFALGASEVKSNSYYTPHDSMVNGAETTFNMDEVNCRGNETSLKNCDFNGWGIHDCNAEEVVGVVCKMPVMKCPVDYWLCETSEECIPTSFMCDNVRDCADGTDEAPEHCNATLEYRLAGGQDQMEGRVEVKFQGIWGTVCDDDFTDKEAYVLCNSLGFTGLATVTNGNFGKSSGPIWLDQVSCIGNETALDKCMHFEWGETNCNHAEDVSVKCTHGDPNQTGRNQQKFPDTTEDLDDISSDTQQYLQELQRSSKSVALDSSVCGQIKVSDDVEGSNQPGSFRVISGTRTKRGHHPWQATIRAKGRNGKSSHWCGAVIISKYHILTAAHCLIGFPKGAYLIRLGDHHSEIAEDSEVEVFIENWYIHEDFRKGQHMNNDIAVILLKAPVQFTNYIQPVCLPPKDAFYEPGLNCTISGWGSIQYGKSTPSLDLKSGMVPIIAQDVCKKKDIYGDAIMDGMFCAGYLGEEGVDACDGDSGGPFVCENNGYNTLYGIISWGQRCGDSSKPGVYVKITQYLQWIQEKINLLQINKASR